MEESEQKANTKITRGFQIKLTVSDHVLELQFLLCRVWGCASKTKIKHCYILIEHHEK